MKTARVEIIPRPLLELVGMVAPEDNPQRRDFEYEIDLAWKVFRKENPLGLRQADLHFDMASAGKDEDVCAVLARKLWATGKFAAYCNAYYGESHNKAQAWSGAEPDIAVLAGLLQERLHDFRLAWLQRHLTSAEILRALHERTFSGKIDDDIYKHPHYIYGHKLALSAWHWHTKCESSKVPWSRVGQFHKFFKAFDFVLPGFDVTIDHSVSWMNRRGHGQYTGRLIDPVSGDAVEGTWLDGEFGLVISRGGKHLLTLGVCTTNAGILVNQIQLKQKKGNRWLYQLPKPYFEYALERLLVAAGSSGLPLFLVTGASHAEELGRVHAEALKADATIAPRIKAIYDQPLKGCKRAGRIFKVNNLAYRRVEAVALPQALQEAA
ncbi:hypothetical protein BH11CYA1_BH11CYA1_34860 [soil metagenome]